MTPELLEFLKLIAVPLLIALITAIVSIAGTFVTLNRTRTQNKSDLVLAQARQDEVDIAERRQLTEEQIAFRRDIATQYGAVVSQLASLEKLSQELQRQNMDQARQQGALQRQNEIQADQLRIHSEQNTTLSSQLAVAQQQITQLSEEKAQAIQAQFIHQAREEILVRENKELRNEIDILRQELAGTQAQLNVLREEVHQQGVFHES